jgi:hypothetical protein
MTHRRTSRVRPAGAVLVAALLSGCYHFRVEVPDPDPATQPIRRTEHAFWWGLAQPRIRATDCLANALDQVQVTSNLGYSLIAVATLGVWVPLEVEWWCAKPQSTVVPPRDGRP